MEVPVVPRNWSWSNGKSNMKALPVYVLAAASSMAFAADVSDIELRRLFEPTAAELTAEASGRIYIYEGLRDIDVERAMGEEFKRVESMMFIRTKKTTETGGIAKDPGKGTATVQDDGC